MTIVLGNVSWLWLWSISILYIVFKYKVVLYKIKKNINS